MSKANIVIVGAGINGLVAANYLQRAGCIVALIGRAYRVGGACVSATAVVDSMANNRLTHVRIPIIGSGHGGSKEEVSLVSMLIAFGELHRRHAGQQFKSVNIVVFRSDEHQAPSIPEASIRRALEFASRYLGE